MKISIRTSVILGLACVSVPAYAQKPIRETSVSTLYKQPPETLSGPYASTQSILVIRVTNARGVETLTPMQRVLTEVTGTIVEIVKPDPQIGPVGASIAFRVSGGEVDKGDHVERHIALGEPKLVAGREYLVALNWEQHENAFFPSYGPNSIFDVTDGVVVSHRETALAAKIKGLTLRQLIAQMTTPPAPSK